MTSEDLYRSLYLIRRVEEEISRVYPTDKIQSPIHLSIGQELASVAVCAALKPTDKAFGSYRSHALYLAKGGNVRAFIAELYGKATGCARGKGGSMHLVEETAGLLGTSAIVGSLIPVAVGYAWAQKMMKTGVVTVCFFGDGATEEGCYFEALSFAALHKVPILFVLENNGYAIHTPVLARQSTSIGSRVRAMGIQVEVARHFHETLDLPKWMVPAVRAGNPMFLEVSAPRLKEHVGIAEDWSLGYREEDRSWKDPVDLAAARLSPAAVSRIREETDAEIADAFAFAESSPFPGPEELMEHLYG